MKWADTSKKWHKPFLLFSAAAFLVVFAVIICDSLHQKHNSAPEMSTAQEVLDVMQRFDSSLVTPIAAYSKKPHTDSWYWEVRVIVKGEEKHACNLPDNQHRKLGLKLRERYMPSWKWRKESQP